MSTFTRLAPSLIAAAAVGSAVTLALVGVGRDHAAVVVKSEAPAEPATTAEALPPNHPPIGGESPHGSMPPASSEPPALSWKMPADWQEAPSPSALRLATYRTPGGAEMSVARAGGTTEANIQRWISQFDQAGADKREEKTIGGMHVTIVQLAGTFEGSGMMTGGVPPQGHPGWALLGAVVETPGSSYFFKMLGPAPAIASAHPSFDALLKSIKPV